VVYVLCTYSGSTQTTGLGFRTARFRLFGSSVIPVGSADWRSRSEVKGDIMAVHTRAVSCPPSRSFASRCESTKIDVLVRAPFSAGFLIHENAHPNVPAVLLLV